MNLNYFMYLHPICIIFEREREVGKRAFVLMLIKDLRKQFELLKK